MIAASHDCVVVGAGPVGLAAALALRQSGFDAVCAGPAPNSDRPDRRTTALLQGSVRFLEALGVWHHVSAAAAPLSALRLVDRTGRLFRAPDMIFESSEIGEDAFGYNVPNTTIVEALMDALGTSFIATSGVTDIERISGATRLSLADDQTATVCNFAHSRPHNGICTEFHYAHGPFTVVPLPGAWSSLVWVERPAEAAALAAMNDAKFAEVIAVRLGGLLGDISETGLRNAFPLSGLVARQLTGERLALVGEAAHVMPPIGAQGLNLGFRDVADLVACAARASHDPGARSVLAAYETARRADVLTRMAAADLLNRTLVSSFLPLQFARGAGLMALSMFAPLRRAAMRQGMAAA